MQSIYKDKQLYDFHNIEIVFRDLVYGGIPKHEELLRSWIESKGESPREGLDEKLEVVDLEEKEDIAWCGFREDDKGLYLRDFQIEAALKVAGTTLGMFVKNRGSKTISQHGLFIRPRCIHLLRDGKPVAKPDRYIEIAGHVMTMQGKRSILKRYDVVQKPTIQFQILLVKNQKKLTWSMVNELLHLAQENGLGSARGMEEGKFDVVKAEWARQDTSTQYLVA